MPKLYELFNGYFVTIWSDEKGEPIHVYICKRRPTENATKFWLCKNGKVMLAHNKSRIPEKDLKRIEKFLNDNFEDIYYSWVAYHNYEKFYK